MIQVIGHICLCAMLIKMCHGHIALCDTPWVVLMGLTIGNIADGFLNWLDDYETYD